MWSGHLRMNSSGDVMSRGDAVKDEGVVVRLESSGDVMSRGDGVAVRDEEDEGVVTRDVEDIEVEDIVVDSRTGAGGTTAGTVAPAMPGSLCT